MFYNFDPTISYKTASNMDAFSCSKFTFKNTGKIPIDYCILKCIGMCLLRITRTDHILHAFKNTID